MSDAEFERRVAAALHTPAPTSARARLGVMERVRASAPSGRPRRSDTVSTGRGVRHSLVGLAFAAGVGSIATLSSLLPAGAGSAPAGVVSGAIGDSVVSTLRDTMRLVRLIFHDTAARQVAVVGDFNGWRVGETPMRRDAASRRWSATVALRDGAHRYAFVVDGTRWVPDPAAIRVRGDDGRVFSLLHVVRSAN